MPSAPLFDELANFPRHWLIVRLSCLRHRSSRVSMCRLSSGQAPYYLRYVDSLRALDGFPEVEERETF